MGLIASATLLFGGAPVANAANCEVPSPSQDQYCPPANITFQGSGPDPSAGPGGSESGLPFTGYDVGLAAFAAAGLIGAGLGLRRVARVEEGT